VHHTLSIARQTRCALDIDTTVNSKHQIELNFCIGVSETESKANGKTLWAGRPSSMTRLGAILDLDNVTESLRRESGLSSAEEMQKSMPVYFVNT
jgi:hypothetical protein